MKTDKDKYPYRIGIILKDKHRTMIADNRASKEECEDLLLEVMEKEEVSRYTIVNRNDISERYSENFDKDLDS